MSTVTQGSRYPEGIIEKILDILEDGKVHTKEEIAEALEASNKIVIQLLKFLSDYNLVVYDQKNQRVTIHTELKRLMRKEKNLNT